eukprot:2268740-Pyramimonas_sp.AAC.1
MLGLRRIPYSTGSAAKLFREACPTTASLNRPPAQLWRACRRPGCTVMHGPSPRKVRWLREATLPRLA